MRNGAGTHRKLAQKITEVENAEIRQAREVVKAAVDELQEGKDLSVPNSLAYLRLATKMLENARSYTDMLIGLQKGAVMDLDTMICDMLNEMERTRKEK